jgi:similar to stage IV sporulation protein
VSGPVVLRFRGLMAEKLIDRARSEGIRIDSAERVGSRETILTTNEPDAKRIMHLAEKFKLDVKIIRVGGLPRVKAAIRRRAAATLSLMIFLSALMLLAGRAWLVEVRLTGADPANLEHAMRSLGVRVGMNLSGLDAYTLSQRLMAEAGDLSYVGVSRQGVRLLIEAIGEDQPPALYNPDAARDLRATRDGVVESITVLAGLAAVKPGDTVVKGQTLIRGEEKVTDELTRGVCALGSVVARVWVTGEAISPLTREEQNPTGRVRTESTLTGPGFRFPLTKAEPFQLEEAEETFLPIGGMFVPLGVARVRHQEMEQKTVPLDEAAVKREISEKALSEALQKQPPSSTTIDKWVDYSMIEGGKIRARAIMELRMNIAGSADSALSEEE